MSLEIHVFGPGYGESILVGLPDGSWGLVDCFSSSGVSMALDYLVSRGIGTLDFFCWTHPDEDHSNGIPLLMSRYHITVKELWQFPAVDARQVVAFIETKFRKLFIRKESSYIVRAYELLDAAIKAGMRLQWVVPNLTLKQSSDYRVVGLAPAPEEVHRFTSSLGAFFRDGPINLQQKHQHTNDISSALLIEYAGCQVVLGGDVTKAGWKSARSHWNRPVGPCLLVKASHHGSEGSYSEEIWREWQSVGPGSVTTIVTTPYRKASRLPSAAGVAKLGQHGKVFVTGCQADPELPTGPGWALLGPIFDPEVQQVTGDRTNHFCCSISASGSIKRDWI